MKRYYVDFMTAFGLLEVGFRVPCDTFYDKNGKPDLSGSMTDDWSQYNAYNMPELDKAHNWLRDTHDLHISTHPVRSGWDFTIWDGKHVVFNSLSHFKTIPSHYEALNEGIKKCIELLKNKPTNENTTDN
jgi:hypothetical protein